MLALLAMLVELAMLAELACGGDWTHVPLFALKMLFLKFRGHTFRYRLIFRLLRCIFGAIAERLSLLPSKSSYLSTIAERLSKLRMLFPHKLRNPHM